MSLLLGKFLDINELRFSVAIMIGFPIALASFIMFSTYSVKFEIPISADIFFLM